MTDQRPNILIIVLDAARAENFSIYGYDLPTTPNLERFAERFAVYRNCISAAIWTLPSTTGLFTGTYPSTHQLEIDGERLSRRFTTLAERLSELGYATAKVTGLVPYVSDFSGLDRGFSRCFEPPPNAMRAAWRRLQRRAARRGGRERREGIDAGLDIKAEADTARRRTLKHRFRYWLTGFSDAGAAACMDHARELWRRFEDRPRFIYMHLQETHAEYRPPHRFRRRFLPDALRYRNVAAVNQRPNPHDLGLVKMNGDDYAILTGLYDGCIAYLDEQIGELLDDLSTRPDFDNTFVLITADHGDCLGRHGILGHQFVCYDELLRIPWVVKWPRSVGITGEQSNLVQNVDLFPTLCALLGIERPAQCEGIDFLSQQRDLAYAELLKPFGVSGIREGHHRMAPQYDRGVLAVRSVTHKCITYSNGSPEELYDLAADPREEHNLLETAGRWPDDAEAQRLCAAMEAWKPRWRRAWEQVQQALAGGDEAEMSPVVEERLRALGYLD